MLNATQPWPHQPRRNVRGDATGNKRAARLERACLLQSCAGTTTKEDGGEKRTAEGSVGSTGARLN